LRTITKSADRIKPIESLLAGSLSSFQITRASLVNLDHTDQPFGFNYAFQSDNYAKMAGNLLLVRPRGARGRGYWRRRSRGSFRWNSKGRRGTPTVSTSRCPRALKWTSYRLQSMRTTALAAITARRKRAAKCCTTRAPWNQRAERSRQQNGRAEKVLSHDRCRRAEYGGSETLCSGEIAGVGNLVGARGFEPRARAPQRRNPVLNQPVIAAVNRCATQNQTQNRGFRQQEPPRSRSFSGLAACQPAHR
jgi:hypothetical protein